MSKSMKMCLSLKLKCAGEIYDETYIITNIEFMHDLIQRKKLNLLVTDGVISIKCNGQELLGEEYIDDVHMVMEDIFFGFDRLLKGEIIIRSLPMTSSVIEVEKRQNNICFVSRSRRVSLQQVTPKPEIPFDMFVEEFSAFYLRYARIFDELGQGYRTFADKDIGEDEIVHHGYDYILDNWEKHIPDVVKNPKMVQRLEYLLHTDLLEWVTNAEC